jgi:thioredoxin-like negative regulator of GroEL
MQIGVLFVKGSNQFSSLLLLQSLQAMVTSNGYKFYESKVNDDDNPLWDRFSISAVPTLIAFDKGKIISRRDTKMGVGLKRIRS